MRNTYKKPKPFMENFEFESQICTTKEQSERLLKLGLKKETADMVYHYQKSRIEAMQWELRAHPPVLRSNCHFNIERLNALKQKNSDGVVMSGEEYFDVLWGKDVPAWSLHRLIEMSAIKDGLIIMNVAMPIELNFYDEVVNTIENLIKDNLFNPQFLEEKK